MMRDHVVPPRLLDITLQFDPERTVVPGAIQAALDFARRENETASLGERDELFHQIH
jgi:hypothetical protein